MHDSETDTPCTVHCSNESSPNEMSVSAVANSLSLFFIYVSDRQKQSIRIKLHITGLNPFICNLQQEVHSQAKRG